MEKKGLSWLWESPQYLKGIGPKKALLLKEYGIETVYDLLYYLPRSYKDFRQETPLEKVVHGTTVAVEGKVEVPPRKLRNRIWKGSVEVQGYSCEVIWLSQELPPPARGLKKGDPVTLVGKVDRKKWVFRFYHPKILKDRPPPGIEPVYRGIPWLSQGMKKVMENLLPLLREGDPLPPALREKENLPSWDLAFPTIHTPSEDTPIEELSQYQSPAFARVAFDQFLFYFLAMELKRKQRENLPAQPVQIHEEQLKRILEILPFSLNSYQEKALREILEDLSRSTPAFRLIQGEVGSGKTVLATIALALVAMEGGQGALLAPTEILAYQHLKFLDDTVTRLGIPVSLLTSSVTGHRRKWILEGLRHGAIRIVVGTHALLEEEVEFHDLRLVVVDEEQRFGVLQRAELKGKGRSPHTLYLSATPIPRSLLLTLLGEVDVSILPERAKKQSVKTVLVPPEKKREVLHHIQTALKKGERIFFLYPRIETRDPRYRSVLEMYERLKKFFGEDRVTFLHGRLSSEEKISAMDAFRKGEKPILVSTSVIEVGVDVESATIMVIGHPELFGLSQLHQLRGRVGRGNLPGTCYLLYDPDLPPETRERLELFARTENGFEVAEADFRLRGPGTIFGTRQSGMPDLPPELFTRYGHIAEEARKTARTLIEEDPQLLLPTHRKLREIVFHNWFHLPEVINA